MTQPAQSVSFSHKMSAKKPRQVRDWRSASQTALEAGHTEVVLFRHYREVVTPDQAAEFWAVLPAKV
jgi:hypothetical protein